MRNSSNSFYTRMFFKYLLLLFFTDSSTLNIGSLNDTKNMTKRDTIGNFYPDWVPFKNKSGDELGEFVDVTKRKPKKRLAPPANFVLKTSMDEESEDLTDKGSEENTAEDYFEKKEWADTTGPDNTDSHKSDPTSAAGVNGIVNILSKSKQNVKPLQNYQTLVDASGEHENSAKEEENEDVENEKDFTDGDKKEISKEAKTDEPDIDYDEDAPEKGKSEKSQEDQSESEAKKAKILDSVDELKERHAEEQRRISEKAKEEEMSKEELVRDSLRPTRQDYDKYNNKASKWRKVTPDYDEYDGKVIDVNDKYKLIFENTATKSPENLKSARNADKSVTAEKLSVFKNPYAYTINDYEDSEEKITTVKPRRMKNSRDKGSKKFSSRYIDSFPKDDERIRISLVPEETDSKEDEPTLFFPKKRTSKRRFKLRTTTEEPVSAEDKTINEKDRMHPTHTTATPDTTTIKTVPTSIETAPSAADTAISASAVSRNTKLVTDTLPAPSETKEKEKKKSENFEYEKGRGVEHHASHEEEHEEHGKKAYEGLHENTKTTKGHHDKEDHLGKYDDHGGVDKHHHDETGHYGHHHHEEHGKKHAKYEESGKHSKGHSTKGSHDIHKKEEYEKNVEFFEEDGDSGEEENHGGYHDEKRHSKGGLYKHGNLKAGHEGHAKGNSGHYSKGGFGLFHKGHKTADGHDHHGRHGNTNFIQEGKETGKKWIYHHGHPPRTANLAIIDRRTDPYLFGPRLYG